jgi:pilus assembly protein CpaC
MKSIISKLIALLCCGTSLSVLQLRAQNVPVLNTNHAAVRNPSTQNPSVQNSAAQNPGAQNLELATGKSLLVECAHPIQRISVGLGDVVEATATGSAEILINGKVPGETSLIVWEAGGVRQFFDVTVDPSTYATSARMEGLGRELDKELPGQKLSVSSEGDMVFLRGTVQDLTSSQRAVEIASTVGKVVNLLYVAVPPTPRQILLKVKFASVDRSLTRSLGLNLFSTGATNTIGTISTGQFAPPSVSLPAGSTSATATLSNELNLFFFRPDLNLGAALEALETQGLVQVLAEPNLLAESGKQASFLAGGEYPYPVVQAVSGTTSGAVTIEFKEYGVRLNFIPTLTPRGTVQLQVAPEVSSLDFTNAVQISGFTVPAIDTRKVNTEVELNPGQSFAIGGLLDNRTSKTFEKIPFLGDIPILGKFFQSQTISKSNTELMVIVTPEIVEPMPATTSRPQLQYPDKFLPPNSKLPFAGLNWNAEKSAAPPPTIPVEDLVKSQQPEKPLIIDDSGTSSGYGLTGGASIAPPMPPPQ